MKTIKRCTRCEIKQPHHCELDEICMDCERELYYPNDTVMTSIVGLMIDRARDGRSITDLYEVVWKSGNETC